MSWFGRQLAKYLTGDIAIGGNLTVTGTSDLTGALSFKTVTLAGVSPNGTTQGSATLLTTGYSRVSGASAANNAVKLPSAALSSHCVVLNYDGGDDLQVFPNTDDAISTAGLNTAITIGPLKAGDFYAVDSTYWVYIT